LPLVGCSTQARCNYTLDRDPFVWADADCPEVIRLQPQSGTTNGGDEITLVGSLFLDRSDSMVAEFTIDNSTEPMTAPVTFISATELQLTSPVSSLDGVANVRLLFNGKQYARQIQTFTYVPRMTPHLPVFCVCVFAFLTLHCSSEHSVDCWSYTWTYFGSFGNSCYNCDSSLEKKKFTHVRSSIEGTGLPRRSIRRLAQWYVYQFQFLLQSHPSNTLSIYLSIS